MLLTMALIGFTVASTTASAMVFAACILSARISSQEDWSEEYGSYALVSQPVTVRSVQ